MKITSTDIEIAKYVIANRAKGYHLLKNPKGTPSTYVSMIKSDGRTNDYNDYVEITKRITKDFANGTEKTAELKATQFSLDGRTLSDKKKVEFSSYDGVGHIEKSKEDDIPVRELPKKTLGFYDAKIDIAYEQDCKSFYKSRLDAIAEFPYLSGEPVRTRPNFFKVLWQNLTQNKSCE